MRDFLLASADVMEREAGHTVIYLLLMFIGLLFWRVGAPKSEDIILISIGGLSRSLGTAAAQGVATAARTLAGKETE